VLRHAGAPSLGLEDISVVAANGGGAEHAADALAHDIVQRFIDLKQL
jgi:hypothetical protein